MASAVNTKTGKAEKCAKWSIGSMVVEWAESMHACLDTPMWIWTWQRAKWSEIHNYNPAEWFSVRFFPSHTRSLLDAPPVKDFTRPAFLTPISNFCLALSSVLQTMAIVGMEAGRGGDMRDHNGNYISAVAAPELLMFSLPWASTPIRSVVELIPNEEKAKTQEKRKSRDIERDEKNRYAAKFFRENAVASHSVLLLSLIFSVVSGHWPTNTNRERSPTNPNCRKVPVWGWDGKREKENFNWKMYVWGFERREKLKFAQTPAERECEGKIARGRKCRCVSWEKRFSTICFHRKTAFGRKSNEVLFGEP